MQKLPVAAFRRAVYSHFAKAGRHLPWRKKVTPYRTFVSEIMLQQTQVPRAAEFFPRFIKRFPGWKRLAEAELKEVLAVWQGLGYNRRARFLHEAAKRVTGEFKGRLPDDPALLATLPGIGKATAASIAAFGFNRPAVFIETNIRAVFIHHYFPTRKSVTDADLLPLVERALDRKNPRRWYSALMDYGTALKRLHGNPARRSAHHVRQPGFEGSSRQARGALVRCLAASKRGMAVTALAKKTSLNENRTAELLAALVKEGLVKERRGCFLL